MWYCFKKEDRNRIIEFCRSKFLQEFRRCGNFLRHKQIIINPGVLKQQFPDLEVFKIVQPVGSYMIAGPEFFMKATIPEKIWQKQLTLLFHNGYVLAQT